MARQMFPPSGKTPARRLEVGLPLGSLVGPGTWAEPGVEGVSRPGRFDPFPAFSRIASLAITLVERDWVFAPGGPRTHATCAGMPPRMAEPVRGFEASRP